MTTLFTNRDFSLVRVDQRQLLERASSAHFVNCSFTGCAVNTPEGCRDRLQVQNFSFSSCRTHGGGVSKVDLVDVLVDGLVNSNGFYVAGCGFQHVTLKGKINTLVLDAQDYDLRGNVIALPASSIPEDIDWALDISDLDCPDLSIRGVPSRLVLRNPDLHAVMTRDAAVDGGWRNIDLAGTTFGVYIRQLVRQGWDDVILPAPRSGPRSKRSLEVLAEMRSQGLVH